MRTQFTPVLSKGELARIWRRRDRRRYDHSPRRVPELNIILGVTGHIQYFVNDSLFQLGPRSLFIAHPSDAHFLVKESSDADATVAAVSQTLLLNPPSHPTFRTSDIDPQAQVPRRLGMDAYEELHELGERLIDCRYRETLYPGLQWWTHRVWHHWQSAPQAAVAATHPGVAEALIIIKSNCELSIVEVARRAGVSPNHLGALFKREVGMTMSAYKSKTRIDYVEQLCFEHPNMPISVAAYKAGFKDYSSFYRAYKSLREGSPRSLRNYRVAQ